MYVIIFKTGNQNFRHGGAKTYTHGDTHKSLHDRLILKGEIMKKKLTSLFLAIAVAVTTVFSSGAVVFAAGSS